MKILYVLALVIFSAVRVEVLCPKKCRCSFQSVDCISSGINEVPQDAPKTTRVLLLSNNNIRLINKSSFYRYTNLQRLSLDSNDLSFIEEGAFNAVRKTLLTLSLKNNNLSSIDKGTIGSLTFLSDLNLSENIIGSIHSEGFYNLQKLRRLFLSRNNLQSLDRFMFIHPTSLITLKLNGNKIRSYDPKVFHHLPLLIDLDLSENLLTSIPAQSFHAQKKLTILTLTGNKLRTLRRGQLLGLRRLTELDMNENDIEWIEVGALGDLVSLRTLQMRNNNLKIINQWTFPSQLIHLKNLFVSGNSITSIHQCAFSGVRDLRTIDISSNSITAIHPQTFAHLDQLYYLNTRNNRISSLNVRTFLIPSLKELYFHGNQIDCSFDYLMTLRRLPISWIVADCLSNLTQGKNKHIIDVWNNVVPIWSERVAWRCETDCGFQSYVRTAACILCSTSKVCVSTLPMNRSCMLLNFKNIHSKNYSFHDLLRNTDHNKGGSKKREISCTLSKCPLPISRLKEAENVRLLYTNISYVYTSCRRITNVQLGRSDDIKHLSDSDMNKIIGLPLGGLLLLAMISHTCVRVWRSKRNAGTITGTPAALDAVKENITGTLAERDTVMENITDTPAAPDTALENITDAQAPPDAAMENITRCTSTS